MARRRDLDTVLNAALELLDDEGLEALTLRAVARRLGAHLNTVSFQVKSKARLLSLMADEILSGLSLDGLPDEPIERVMEIVARYRQALLARRDAARLVAGTSVLEKNTLAIGEAMLEALLEAGLPSDVATRVFWSLSYFTLGLVQEEQDARPETKEWLVKVLADGHYPAIERVADPLVDDPFQARFDYGVRALIGAAETGLR